MLRPTLALLLLAVATLSSAQNLDDRDSTLRVDVELVQLPVSVLDKEGLPVRGLQKEHFTVFEDKVQQDVQYFSAEDVALSGGILLDGAGGDHRHHVAIEDGGAVRVGHLHQARRPGVGAATEQANRTEPVRRSSSAHGLVLEWVGMEGHGPQDGVRRLDRNGWSAARA